MFDLPLLENLHWQNYYSLKNLFVLVYTGSLHFFVGTLHMVMSQHGCAALGRSNLLEMS